jgi:hypothetical protein
MRSKTILAAVLCCTFGLAIGIAHAENPLVYVSYITGATSGGTNIYEISSGEAKLLGSLNKGGGGPVAVDADENVYVVGANLDSNGYQSTAAVFMYARGSKQGKNIFTAKNLGAAAMTVGADGTVYIVGQVPNTSVFSVVKFTPPDYTPEILRKSQNPRYPTGISLDAAGNIFVGWTDSFKTVAIDPCGNGCVQELPSGGNKWIVRLRDYAAFGMAAGPIVTADGSLVFRTDEEGKFDYVETVTAGKKYPSIVSQISPFIELGGGSNASLTLNADGSRLWAAPTGFAGGLGSSVVGINYPKGTVGMTFTIDSPQDLAWISGTAVSPAYYP